jgi:hypothetical protein
MAYHHTSAVSKLSAHVHKPAAGGAGHSTFHRLGLTTGTHQGAGHPKVSGPSYLGQPRHPKGVSTGGRWKKAKGHK